MCYGIETIRKKDYTTSEWSGGTTTQLLIYPKDAVYSERNFKWRLSSARVEVAESEFTFLPGISRIIMIIEGELRLKHQDHHSALLNKFDQDSFSGEWKTKSYGKVTDFNLMMARGCSGKLDHILLNKGQMQNVILHTLDDENYSKLTDVFYCVNGEVEISTDMDEKLNLAAGDLISVTRGQNELPNLFKFVSTAEDKSEIIRATIYYQ